MARIYKRTRRKTGPNSWQTITHRNDGTSFTSSSTKVGNNTTNISSRGVRKTTNNKGWIQTSFTPAFPKAKTKKSTSSKKGRKSSSLGFLAALFGSSKSKKKTSTKKPAKNTSATASKPEVVKPSETKSAVPVVKIEAPKKPDFIGPPKPPNKILKVIKWIFWIYIVLVIVSMMTK